MPPSPSSALDLERPEFRAGEVTLWISLWRRRISDEVQEIARVYRRLIEKFLDLPAQVVVPLAGFSQKCRTAADRAG